MMLGFYNVLQCSWLSRDSMNANDNKNENQARTSVSALRTSRRNLKLYRQRTVRSDENDSMHHGVPVSSSACLM